MVAQCLIHSTVFFPSVSKVLLISDQKTFSSLIWFMVITREAVFGSVNDLYIKSRLREFTKYIYQNKQTSVLVLKCNGWHCVISFPPPCLVPFLLPVIKIGHLLNENGSGLLILMNIHDPTWILIPPRLEDTNTIIQLCVLYVPNYSVIQEQWPYLYICRFLFVYFMKLSQT